MEVTKVVIVIVIIAIVVASLFIIHSLQKPHYVGPLIQQAKEGVILPYNNQFYLVVTVYSQVSGKITSYSIQTNINGITYYTTSLINTKIASGYNILYATFPLSVPFVAGKQYSFTVTLNNVEFNVTAKTIVYNVTAIGGGSLYFVNPGVYNLVFTLDSAVQTYIKSITVANRTFAFNNMIQVNQNVNTFNITLTNVEFLPNTTYTFLVTLWNNQEIPIKAEYIAPYVYIKNATIQYVSPYLFAITGNLYANEMPSAVSCILVNGENITQNVINITLANPNELIIYVKNYHFSSPLNNVTIVFPNLVNVTFKATYKPPALKLLSTSAIYYNATTNSFDLPLTLNSSINNLRISWVLINGQNVTYQANVGQLTQGANSLLLKLYNIYFTPQTPYNITIGFSDYQELSFTTTFIPINITLIGTPSLTNVSQFTYTLSFYLYVNQSVYITSIQLAGTSVVIQLQTTYLFPGYNTVYATIRHYLFINGHTYEFIINFSDGQTFTIYATYQS